MANQERGEVTFEADGQTWTLQFSINALCDLEDKLEVPITEVGKMMGGEAAADGKGEAAPAMRLSLMRTLVWAGLQEHHEGLTERQAGNLIQAAGMGVIGEKIGRAFTLAFPEAAKGNGGPRRKPAQGGAG